MMSSSIHSGYEIDNRPVDILSISSQLVYGSVGNNAGDSLYATKNIRRIKIPTILLSSLPHYEGVQVHPIDHKWFDQSLTHLRHIGVIEQLKYVTVGYLGDARQAEVIAQHFRNWQNDFPDLQLILDPTMGDYDVGIYVADGIAQAHKDLLLPLASGLTPNLFELEVLTGQKIRNESDMLHAARSLLSETVRWVAVTSSTNFHPTTEDIGEAVSDTILWRDDSSEIQEYTLSRPKISSAAKGAGDHFMSGMVTALTQGITPVAAIDIAATSVVEYLTHETA